MRKIPKNLPNLFPRECEHCREDFFVSRRCCRKLSPRAIDVMTRFCCWGCAAKHGLFTEPDKALAKTDVLSLESPGVTE